nr:Bm1159 [Brugia malayi]
MRLCELNLHNSNLILDDIKQKLREVKQEKLTLPESEYKEFKADMFDDLKLPFTINLLINDQNETVSVSSNIDTAKGTTPVNQ